MSSSTLTWLTQEGYESLSEELSQLLSNRASRGQHRDEGDDIDLDERQWQKMRIRQLEDLLRTARVGSCPADDGIVEPGMVVTVRYADDPETESFLLATRAAEHHRDLEITSPDSPLGLALLGAREGEEREYTLPRGGTMTVTLVKVEPFHGGPATVPEQR
ncbi:GreA/GreB family elongation factor [Parasphingorhabdus pacifica]